MAQAVREIAGALLRDSGWRERCVESKMFELFRDFLIYFEAKSFSSVSTHFNIFKKFFFRAFVTISEVFLTINLDLLM